MPGGVGGEEPRGSPLSRSLLTKGASPTRPIGNATRRRSLWLVASTLRLEGVDPIRPRRRPDGTKSGLEFLVRQPGRRGLDEFVIGVDRPDIGHALQTVVDRDDRQVD